MNTPTNHLRYNVGSLYPYVIYCVNEKGVIALLTTIVVLYACGVTIYNLYFSPLAGFPGPKVAAATGYYEFYYDFFKKGTYIFEIEQMHKKYGLSVRPLISINA